VIEQKIGSSSDQKRLALLWATKTSGSTKRSKLQKREYQARKDIYTADAHAWILYKKGRLDEAKTAMDACDEIEKPRRAVFSIMPGMIAKDAGDKKEARKMLESALKINPAFDLIQAENARRALSELQ
jgi:tetratricopeptide (TPR) repeat protein